MFFLLFALVHQLIMGAGKTTVIAPLLALSLADGKRLVCVCMPAALLDFSRSVLVERFSSPVMPKPVLTFRFFRFTVASSDMVAKLQAAVSCQGRLKGSLQHI